MITYSIKTVDGNRYDFITDNIRSLLIELHIAGSDWLKIQDRSVTRLFYKPNIVCITIKEADDA
ncbi:MAG: hypothetical protein IKO00_00455 [Oscillospiraceae bacterium]|nr:hypothetical protein [Oscillospiraceae bacterium]